MRWSSRAFKYVASSLVRGIASLGGASASDLLFIADNLSRHLAPGRLKE